MTPQAGPGARWAWWLMGVAVASHLVSWFAIGPLQDEAYYWTWTQHLQLSYFDHPPMVAWWMWPFTQLLGDQLWVIRLPTVLGWFVTTYLVYRLARDLNDRPEAGAYAALAWTSLPIIMGGFHIVTPDTPLVTFVALTYFLYTRSLARGSDLDWLLTGAAAGLALLAKYTAILVPGALFLALLLQPAGRRRLLRRGPWLAVVAMLLTFLPVVAWNAQNDWASFLFQFKHGIQGLTPAADQMLLAFIAGQLGVAMPWTFVAMLLTALRLRLTATAPRLTFQLGFLLPLLAFGAAGMTAESGANWTLAAYVPGSVLLGGVLARWLDHGSRLRPTLLALLYLLPLLLVNLMRFPSWMEALGVDPAQRTQLTHSYGWDRVGEQMRGELQRLGPAGDTCTVMGMNYQVASELALALGDVGRVTTPRGSRISQYDYWRDVNPPCLYVAQYDQASRIPAERIELEGYGQWRRSALLENHNPDNTQRWFGFYLPE